MSIVVSTWLIAGKSSNKFKTQGNWETSLEKPSQGFPLPSSELKRLEPVVRLTWLARPVTARPERAHIWLAAFTEGPRTLCAQEQWPEIRKLLCYGDMAQWISTFLQTRKSSSSCEEEKPDVLTPIPVLHGCECRYLLFQEDTGKQKRHFSSTLTI